MHAFVMIILLNHHCQTIIIGTNLFLVILLPQANPGYSFDDFFFFNCSRWFPFYRKPGLRRVASYLDSYCLNTGITTLVIMVYIKYKVELWNTNVALKRFHCDQSILLSYLVRRTRSPQNQAL